MQLDMAASWQHDALELEHDDDMNEHTQAKHTQEDTLSKWQHTKAKTTHTRRTST